jgi:hypothetical protein
MLHHEHLEVFGGLPVVDFGEPDQPVAAQTAPSKVAWRLRVDRDGHRSSESWGDHFDRFLATVDTSQVQAVIIGCWSDAWEVYAQLPRDLLVGAADRFPRLRALFFGEFISEEMEISWIPQVDITPLLHAFPRLEELWTRGGAAFESEGLKLRPGTYPALRRLVMQSCGLPRAAVRGVAASQFPALEHLELWPGDKMRSSDAMVEDVGPILDGSGLPKLRHLGLQDSSFANDIAVAIASAAVVGRLESLDLSMGNMTDRGAQALFDGQSLAHLRSLNLRRNYLSEAMAGRLRDAWPGVLVNLDDQATPPAYFAEEDYFVEVHE